jgi:hypothetical protein
MNRLSVWVSVAAGACAVLPAVGEEKKPPTAEDRAEQAEAKREHEELVKGALEELKTGLREAKTPNDRVAVIRKVSGAERDPRIAAELVRLLVEPEVVRVEVMAALGKYRRDRVAGQGLVAALATSAKNPSLLSRNLTAIGEVGVEAALPALAKYARDENTIVAAAAAVAMGGLNCAAAVDQVILAWEEQETLKKKGGDAKSKAEARLKAVGPSFKESLQRLTGQKYYFVEEHKSWWLQNRAAFKPKDEPPGLCPHFGGPPIVAPAAVAGGAPAAAPGAAPAAAPPAAGPNVEPESAPAPAAPATPPAVTGTFVRAINLNGPVLPIDAHDWEAGAGAAGLKVSGGRPFEARTGVVTPATDENRARMLRTGLSNTGTLTLTVGDLPNATYAVCLYIWEDDRSEMYSLTVQGQPKATNFSTGTAGRWERLGPWTVQVPNGTLEIVATGGAVNLCGLEIYRKE